MKANNTQNVCEFLKNYGTFLHNFYAFFNFKWL